jgi:hypothetical protein
VYKVLLGKDHSKGRSVDGRLGSEWILGRLAGGRSVEWIQLAQDEGRYRALVNTMMNPDVLAPQSRLVSYHLFVVNQYTVILTHSNKYIINQDTISSTVSLVLKL